MDWKEIVSVIGVISITQSSLIAVVGYFAKRLFEHSMNKSLESRKNELNKSLEVVKSDLNKEFENYKLKLNLIHTKRFEVIDNLYKKLIDLRNSIYILTNKLKASNGNFEEEEKERIEDTDNKYIAFITYYNYHKIYFSVDTCEILDKMRDMFWRSALDYSQIQRDKALGISGAELKETYIQAMKAGDFVRTEIPKVLEELEADFRKLVGVIN